MGYKLCICEKPSVAKDIARVIEANKMRDGYYEGNGYLVTWAVGHLVGLAGPEDYGYVPQKEMFVSDEMKKQAYDELPLIPDEFKLIVLPNTKEQFAIVKKLMHRADVDMIIDCGDMGPEGHVLQWLIREKANCSKPVKRFCATSMTDEAITKAFNELRPITEFEGIIRGEFSKKKADWMLGMSLSRVETLKYQSGINVGRVMSPTLYFIVDRYFAVNNFKVTNYYGLVLETAQGFKVFWDKDINGLFPNQNKDTKGHVLEQSLVQNKANEIQNDGKVVVSNIKSQKMAKERPQLFDITELQREANRRYGYTAAFTLANAQYLYETSKVLSYPRTDSRYITSDLVPYMKEKIKAIGKLDKFSSEVDKLLENGLNIDKRIVDDSKVTDHHALIPTERINEKDFTLDNIKVDLKAKTKDGVTTESLQNIFLMILERMIVSFSQPYKYEKTSILVNASGMDFSATGTKEIQSGWKGVEERLNGKCDEEESEEKQIFPDIKEGDVIPVSSCAVTAKTNTPPKLHTEATLLTAMENAGSVIENGSILKGKGIGTQATRAEIIKKLFDKGYVKTEMKGKTPYIIPTQKGIGIIKVLPVELYSPKITADWEEKISKIADGSMTEDAFLDEFKKFITEKCNEVKIANINISFKPKKEPVASCPFCENNVFRYQPKGEKVITFYCGNKDCCFRLVTNDKHIGALTKKSLTEKQALRFINEKKIILKCRRNNKDVKRKFFFIKNEVNEKVFCNVTSTDVK